MALLALPDSSPRTLVATSPSMPRGRVLAIDVTRGLLMCVITIGHAQILLNDSEANRWLGLLISKITNLGTPAFTCISGILLGYFECTYSDFRRIRRKYFTRAIQLLTIAHLLIAIGTYPLREEKTFAEAYLQYWYITDTLAILFMVLPTLLPRLNLSVRVGVGILFLLSWKVVSIFPESPSPVLLAVKEILFSVNAEGPHLFGDTYPLIPLAGLFMIGTVIGNGFGQSLVQETLERFVSRLRRSIVPLILLSGFFVGIWAWGKLHSGSLWGGYLRALFYPEKLYSLLPFYLAILFLIFSYFINKLEIDRKVGRGEKALALFGKNSLFTYVAQYFLVQTIPSLIGWRNRLNLVEMALYLGGAMMLLYYLVRFYNDASFFKPWGTASETKQLPKIKKKEKEFDAPLDAPELLDLKKDLW